MRTARALTVSPSMLCQGEVSALGGCLLRGVCVCPGGSALGGCLLCGGLLQGGICSGGGGWVMSAPSMHWGRPPLWTEFLTHAYENILPCPKLRLQAVTSKHSIRARTIRLLTIHTCFSSHQMSAPDEVLKWTSLNRSQSWPPDVTTRGPCTVKSMTRGGRGLDQGHGGSFHGEVPCLGGWWLYSEVSCRGGKAQGVPVWWGLIHHG